MTKVAVLAAALGLAQAASAQFANSNYNESIIFTDGGGGPTVMGIAHDGSHYWSNNGGFGTNPVYEYDNAGTLLNTYNVPIDQRSIFSDGSGNIYLHPFSSQDIYKQVSPGNFQYMLTLSGGSVDGQAGVVWTGSEYICNNYGTVNRWDGSGNFIGTTSLSGFGGMNNEGNYPQGRGVAYGGGYYLTYSEGVLSAWDAGGNRTDTTILNNAGQSFDSHFGFSYDNGMAFVVDSVGGQWRGYDVGLVPAPGAAGLLGLAGLVAGRRRR